MSDTIEDCLRMCRAAYPEYASIDPDTFSELMAELATLRANQLPANVVAAVRAYQDAHVAYVKFIDALREPGEILETHPVVVAERKTFKAVYRAIEVDAKERG